MNNSRIHLTGFSVTVFSFSMLLLPGNLVVQAAQADSSRSMDPAKARVVEYWTSERRASAIPRDFVIDPRGLGYLRRPDGSLQPYGHQIAAQDSRNPNIGPPPGAGGGGSNDTERPVISDMHPAQGETIGGTHTFSAIVTDNVGVKSVSFTIQYPDGSTTQTFDANAGANNTWSVTLQGFTDSDFWSWWIVAKDTAKKGGNTTTSPIIGFKVDTSGSGGSGGNSDTVTNAEWADGVWANGGAVQMAAGRLYFEMPKNAKWKGPWAAFVCSGTAVTDDTYDPGNGRSIILTAAHCVYDDANKAFARNVLFIPNQAATSGSGTDQNCNNDPIGCWVPSYGVVDSDWTGATFPANILWDYAYYVVDASGAHLGDGTTDDSLEVAAGTLTIDFATPVYGTETPDTTSADYTHALGYSYNVDPNLMYCAEDMTTEGTANWWLGSCGLSGGSSGGPWVQPMNTVTGIGPVISLNSWGYTGSPGMAGPKLDSASASCVFGMAASGSPPGSTADGEAGTAVNTAVDCP